MRLAQAHGAGGLSPEALEVLEEELRKEAAAVVDEALVDADARGATTLELRDLEPALRHRQ